MALTPKQKAFCDEYLANGYNGTQAALKVGYSKKTAYSIAGENLKKPEIKAYIAEAKKKLYTNRIATAKELLETLTSIIRDEEVTTNNRLKAIQLMGDHLAIFEGVPEKDEKSALDKLCDTISEAVK
nr:MAG TPA: Terminase small subunit [Caudoviricetes sp.]